MKPLPHHDATASRLPLPRVYLLLEEKKWDEATVLLEQLRDSLASEPHAPEHGEWHLLSARLAVETGRYRDAVDLARQALAFFQLTSADDFLGETHSILGLAYLGLGETKNAGIHARDALAIYRRLGDQPGMMRACNDLAHIHFVRGDYAAATEHLTDAVEIARRQNEPDREAMFLGNLGRVFLLQGEWNRADQALSQAHVRAAVAGNQTSVGRNLLSLAFLAVLRHDFRLASTRLDAALTAIEASHLVRERAIYFEYSGWWQFEQRHWIAAKESFRRALEIGRRLSAENDLVSQSLRGLAECDAALGDWNEAARMAREGLTVAIAIAERSEVGCLYRVLARVLAHLGESEESSACLQKADECLAAVGDVYELARLETVRAEILAILEPANTSGPITALERASALLHRLGAKEQLAQVQLQLVEALARTGQMARAVATARSVLDDRQLRSSGQDADVLKTLAGRCVEHSLSGDNEFRLGGMPWTPAGGPPDEAPTDGHDLQSAIDSCRTRINASRVLLVEVTADGERTGRVMAQAGADDVFARRLATFAASTYQTELPTDRPRFFWALPPSSTLATHLSGDGTRTPVSVISVPVELGPQSSGILYADLVAESGAPSPPGFSPRDLDFTVAFAEVVAWRSVKLRSEGLMRDVRRLRDQLGRECEFPSIITQNLDFRETLARTRLIVDADVSVLLQGETGTGKDLLARAIHYSGVRRDRRFVSVNCAALPETLLESELFGVRRGAFTGADRDKIGLFEEADGGTFFLDEIGEMPLSIQTKLLRLLESKEVVRLGDTRPRPVDVRVISATNRDLSDQMEHGGFRRDLYYRLTPVVFTLPPLRERREDIPLLVDHFLDLVAEQTGRRATLAPEVTAALCTYQWPGNVRELDNEIRKLVLLSQPDSVVGPDRLSKKIRETSADEASVPSDQPMPDRFSLYDHVAQIERRYIVRALSETGGVKKHAAQRLGIPESTLRLKMKMYSLGSD
ncbi:MAG: sigma 54-interacting transcriptional regulator [candidate division Zixibacteria bacterium]|nr:sigma 54-interacting transcriptional regulator [candidate division Zixibacteria bacterium]